MTLRRAYPRQSRSAVTPAIVLLLGATLVSVGCSGDTNPVAPSPASDVAAGAGVWVGSVSDPVAGSGGATLSLSEQPGAAAPGALVGTWVFTFRSGETCAGVAEGQLTNRNSFGLFLYVEPSPSCLTPSSVFPQFQLTDAAVTGSRLTASLYRTSGAVLRVGSVSLVKQ